jgi:hypothetical protein
MALNLAQTVVDFLKQNQGNKYTARDIANWIFDNRQDECAAKKERSDVLNSDEDLIQQLVREIGAYQDRFVKLSNNTVKMTAERPRKYYYTDKTDFEEIECFEKKSSNGTLEADLYPILAEFLYSSLNINPKRINEKTSSNNHGKEGNIWLHPDLVGLEVLSKKWDKEVVECVNKHAYNITNLWSFEVKIKLNSSNVRKAFFQTVSNSSWANYGYLVATEIADDIMDELRMLCSAHGIGIISLAPDNPNESQILIPAQEKEIIDWNIVNRIAKENKDFMNYVKLIKQFYQTGEVKEQEWDIPPSLINS